MRLGKCGFRLHASKERSNSGLPSCVGFWTCVISRELVYAPARCYVISYRSDVCVVRAHDAFICIHHFCGSCCAGVCALRLRTSVPRCGLQWARIALVQELRAIREQVGSNRRGDFNGWRLWHCEGILLNCRSKPRQRLLRVCTIQLCQLSNHAFGQCTQETHANLWFGQIWSGLNNCGLYVKRLPIGDALG